MTDADRTYVTSWNSFCADFEAWRTAQEPSLSENDACSQMWGDNEWLKRLKRENLLETFTLFYGNVCIGLRAKVFVPINIIPDEQTLNDPWWGIPSCIIPKDGRLSVHKIETGGVYMLRQCRDDVHKFYLSANDGLVPSGQYVYGSVRRILDDFGLEIIL